jgi:hypothetical protein
VSPAEPDDREHGEGGGDGERGPLRAGHAAALTT